MGRFYSIAVGAAVALVSISLAHADPVTGAWKLSVGVNDDPCVVTLAADQGSDSAGSARATGDCNGVSFEHWRSVGDRLQLQQANGALVAFLHAKEGGFEGKRVSDGKLVALNR
ncbi:MAG: AprI/Inh family metalloprotease inhibitor [Alphaproteobacteria bacterium]|nr:AprI/Inh family metalloprotease inhibitor [Alphaproteobacteria bacterium]MBV9061631.1 AprI/Inh family metalloprotease inhibitor [Alphaproteobacteria bacterium]